MWVGERRVDRRTARECLNIHRLNLS